MLVEFISVLAKLSDLATGKYTIEVVYSVYVAVRIDVILSCFICVLNKKGVEFRLLYYRSR